MKQQNFLVTIALILLFTSAGFYGGIKFQQSRGFMALRAGNGQQMMRLGAERGGFARQDMGRARVGQIIGEVISSDDKSVTVKLNDGSTKIILLTSSTSISNATEATQSDLKSGATVAVFGPSNNDGSVTAVSIQLNPQIRIPQGGPTLTN